MNVQRHLLTDLRRQVDLLPDELDAWLARAQSNEAGMGIHLTQIEAVKVLFNGLQDQLADLLAGLDPDQDADTFARQRRRLETSLSGTHGIVSVFRHILDQRGSSEGYRIALDAADRIAANCYRPFMQWLRENDLLPEGQFRQPPLTFFNARYSPTAYTRGHVFKALGLPLDGFVDLKLPIGVISLPFYQSVVLWGYCSLYHEVGHLFDQDLDLRKAFSEPLNDAGIEDEERLDSWQWWLREIQCDAIGVLLGGDAFAHALTAMLLLPHDEVMRMDVSAVHPPHYLRFFLLGALLRQAADAFPNADLNALREAADEIEQQARDTYDPVSETLAPYLDDVETVARVLMTTPIQVSDASPLALPLPQLFNTLSEDHATMYELADLLAQEEEPELEGLSAPVRLVPGAALLALRRTDENLDTLAATIHRRALALVPILHTEQTMASLSDDERTYMRDLVAAIDFEAFAAEPGRPGRSDAPD